MSLWFTTTLATFELQDDESFFYSSPFRVNLPDGAITWYRLTPDSLSWINRMMERAEKKYTSGGLALAKLVEFRKRHAAIKQWAAEHFTHTELMEAEKRALPLPVEPAFNFDWSTN